MTIRPSNTDVSTGKTLAIRVFLAASLLLLSQSTGAAAPLNTSFSAVDDTFVRSSLTSARKNFGRELLLEIQNTRGTESEGYIKFDLAGTEASLTEAQLRIYAMTEKEEPTILLVHSVADNNWLETIMTWRDKPVVSGGVGELEIAASGWYELDITSFVRKELMSGNDTITLALVGPEGSNAKILVNSREAVSNQPEIVINRTLFKSRIVFQPREKPLPPTYVGDHGAPFGSRGNGLAYGWSTDISKYVRDRGNPAQQEGTPAKAPDTRYNSVAFMDHAEMSKPAFWEIAVPNGKYRVHLVAGDACASDSIYAVTVEDVLLVDGVPDDKKRWAENSRVIEVKDGRLTVNNHTKGINNKVCFIEIAEINER